MNTKTGTAFDLYYEIAGPEQSSALVFSHALGGDLSMWDRQFAQLAGSYRVLRYDMRGHGRSGQPSGPLSLADLGGDVLKLLEYHSIARAHFCGLSIGGMIGQWLGMHASERLRSLILVDTAPRIGDDQTWDARIAQIQQHGIESIAGPAMERWFTKEFREREPRTVAHFEQVLRTTAQPGYIACAEVVRRGVLSPGQFDRLSSIEIPVLVITGKEDTAAPPDLAKALASYIPGACYVEFPTAHITPVEDGPGFLRALTEFLQSVNE